MLKKGRFDTRTWYLEYPHPSNERIEITPWPKNISPRFKGCYTFFFKYSKSANVFLNKDGSVKLGDMNVSKLAKKGLLYTQTGTPYYASPEVWKDQPYDSKSDIWSLGCVLYEMTTLKP